MNFFKKMFSPNNKQANSEQAAQFDAEWFAAVKRFGIVAGFNDFRFDLRHPQTKEIMKPHEGLGGNVR